MLLVFETEGMKIHKREDAYLLTMAFGPKKVSAFTFSAFEQMHQAMDFLEKKKDEQFAVVVTGTGKFFSPGFDLQQIKSPEGPQLTRTGFSLLARMLVAPFPIIAAINGHAFGFGIFLALASDFRVMTTGTGFLCMPEITINMPLSQPFADIARSKMSPQALFKSALLGYRWPAKEALKEKIIDFAAPLEQVVPISMKMAQKMSPLTQNKKVMSDMKHQLNIDSYNSFVKARL